MSGNKMLNFYRHSYIKTYIYKYIHTYIHTHAHTHPPTHPPTHTHLETMAGAHDVSDSFECCQSAPSLRPVALSILEESEEHCATVALE